MEISAQQPQHRQAQRGRRFLSGPRPPAAGGAGRGGAGREEGETERDGRREGGSGAAAKRPRLRGLRFSSARREAAGQRRAPAARSALALPAPWRPPSPAAAATSR